VRGRLGQLIRYGGTAAVVDLAGFAMLELTELTVAHSAALSFLMATVFNYGLTARFVFRSPANIRGYGRFLAAAAAGFGINVGITVLAIWYFDMHPVTAKTLGIGLALFRQLSAQPVVRLSPEGCGRIRGTPAALTGRGNSSFRCRRHLTPDRRQMPRARRHSC
jgi:putative flippase GtrA